MPEQKLVLDIPIKTVLKVLLTIIGLVLLYLVRDIILLFVFVLLLFSVLNPIVNKWEEEMSRKAAISALFAIIILFIVAVGLLIIPPLASQVQEFIKQVPNYLEKLVPVLDTSEIKDSLKSLSSFTNEIGKFGISLYNKTIGFFGGLIAVFTVIVSAFYLLAEKDHAKKFMNKLPIKNKKEYFELFEKISEKMGMWMRGQLSLMVIVGVLDLIGLFALKIPYALALGLWAGLTELIPYVGPVLGAIPAVLIGLSISPLTGLLVLIVFLIVQQIEAQFLVPKIMGKMVGLSPVVIIFAVLIGAKLLGVFGVILAVPIAAAINVFLSEYPLIEKKEE